MATQFPSNYAVFGLTAETGVVTDNVTWNYSQDSKAIRNATGDTIAKAYYDERIEISFAGYLPATTPYATTLAASLTLATTPTDYLKGSVGSLTVVESITRTNSNEDYQRIEVNAMNHSLLTS